MTPRPRMLIIASAVIPILLIGIPVPALRGVAVIFNVLFLAVAVADRILTPSLSKLAVSRQTITGLSVGTTNTVELIVRNNGRETVSVELFDETPDPGTTHGLPATLDVPGRREREVTYQLIPHERGHGVFSAIHLRVVSRFGLWTLSERREVESRVRIFPDIRAVVRYELMARKNRLEELGLKMHRLRGQGSNFERLRDYRREDELRQIDWKATSRQQRLISREFNVERNQNVIIVLDCGRSMRNEGDGVSYLDRGLNAAIMLSYIALAQGDNVGFMAVSSRIERAVKPLRGKPAIQTVLQHSFDLEPRNDASDYMLAFEHLSRHYRKRALVVLLTHVIDEQHLESISQPLRSIRSPHLFLCVFLKELGLTRLANRVPNETVDAFHSAAAAELLSAITRGTADLKDRGVLILETLPDQLTANLVNQYLDVKARHLM